MSVLDADVVVVGAGPAGLAVASRLSARGRSVLVVDSGGMHPTPDLDAGDGRVEGPLPYFALAPSRTRGLGGSTALWGGWCEPLDDIDFGARPGSAPTTWCIDRSTLDPFYRDALAFCGVPPTVPFHRWALATDDAVTRSGFHPRSFAVLGPRQLGRRHAALFDREGIDLLLGANVTRIVVTPDGGSVDHLLVARDGSVLRISGRSFVLAAGGLETPRLLLASASDTWPRGIGNAHDLVGRFFMEHPHVDVARVRGDVDALDLDFFTERTVGETLDGELMADAGALVLGGDGSPRKPVGRVQLFLAAEPTTHHLPFERQGRVHRPRRRSATGEICVVLVTEQFPNRSSRVVLGNAVDRHGVPLPHLRWELTAADHHTAMWGTTRAVDLLIELGCTSARRRLARGKWPLDTIGGPHHLGTARMALSPEEGVVDETCRVHDVSNLFVAGGAVFPTVGYAPPTLTIIALALRLADHLHELSNA